MSSYSPIHWRHMLTHCVLASWLRHSNCRQPITNFLIVQCDPLSCTEIVKNISARARSKPNNGPLIMQVLVASLVKSTLHPKTKSADAYASQYPVQESLANPTLFLSINTRRQLSLKLQLPHLLSSQIPQQRCHFIFAHCLPAWNKYKVIFISFKMSI